MVELNKNVWSREKRLWEGRKLIIQTFERLSSGRGTEFIHCGSRREDNY